MTYNDIYIYAGHLQTLTRGDGDKTGIPPEASLIVADDEWAVMCQEAGGEDVLIAELGVTDMREVENGQES